MQSDKKKFELHVVRVFQNAGGLPSDFKLSNTKNDPPDVKAERSNEVIGIEVRRLFTDEKRKGSSQRRDFNLCQKVINKAQELHSKSTNESYDILVVFNRHYPIDDKQVENIAEKLVNQIKNIKPEMNKLIEFKSEKLYGTDWPKEVQYMRYINCTKYIGKEGPKWHSADWACEDETNTELIQKALDVKETHLKSFPNDISRRWLLLVCDGSVESSFLRLHEGIDKESFRSSYDRVFIMDYSGKRYKELNV